MSNNSFVPAGGNATVSASSGSRWITNPRQLNKVSVFNTKLQLKTSSSGITDSSTSGFFTALALRGAQTSITAANTYVTIASLTGSGHMVNCISPTHTALFTPSFRITADGIQYISTPSAPQTIANRFLLGPITPTPSLTVDGLSVNGVSDNGFWIAQNGGVTQVTGAMTAIGIPNPEDALSYAMQTLRFESSLLIEVKCDLLSANAIDKQCGATYILDL